MSNKYNRKSSLPIKLVSAMTVALISSGFLAGCMEEQDVRYQNRMSDNNVLQDTTSQETNSGIYGQGQSEYPYVTNNQNTQSDSNPILGNTETNAQPNVVTRESEVIVNSGQNGMPNNGWVSGDSDIKTYPEQTSTYNNPNMTQNSQANGQILRDPDINNYPQNSQPDMSQSNRSSNQPNINTYPQTTQNTNQSQPATQQSEDNRIVYENEEEAKNDYLLKKNQEIIDELRNEIKLLHKKIDYISTRVGQNQQSAKIPGLEGLNATTKANNAKELAQIKQRSNEMKKKLADLEMDQEKNFSTTKQVMVQEKEQFTVKVGKELSVIQEKINSNQVNVNQKQKLEKIYQLTNANLNKLKFITPDQNWDSIKYETEGYIKAINPSFKG